jgi:glycosyltransferase involved in cell wall biosynthesis
VRLLLDVSAIPARPVGAGRYVVELTRHLAGRADPAVTLLARRHDADRWSRWHPSARVLPLAPDARPARVAWEQLRGESARRTAGVDVWHGPHYTLPRGLAGPAVVTVHDLTFFDHPELHEAMKVRFFRRAITEAARRADALIAVSDATAERLHDLLAPTAPVVVAPHGLDHERLGPVDPGDDDERRRRLGVDQPYVAFVGTLEPRKDVPALVAAFARLAPARPDLRLVLAGPDGWGTAAVRAAIAEHGVATRVGRVGYLADADLAALMRGAAALAYPSLGEGFGLPVLEALACGTPVVTTSTTPFAARLADAALVVPPSDPVALAGALEAALDDAATMDRLRAAGPPLAAGFTWDRSVEAHLQAYALAVDGRG